MVWDGAKQGVAGWQILACLHLVSIVIESRMGRAALARLPWVEDDSVADPFILPYNGMHPSAAAVSSSQQQSAAVSNSQPQPATAISASYKCACGHHLCSHSPLIKASFSTIHSEPHYMPHLAPNPLTHLALRYFPYPMIPPRLMLSTWYMYMQREVYSCSDYAVNTLLT